MPLEMIVVFHSNCMQHALRRVASGGDHIGEVQFSGRNSNQMKWGKSSFSIGSVPSSRHCRCRLYPRTSSDVFCSFLRPRNGRTSTGNVPLHFLNNIGLRLKHGE